MQWAPVEHADEIEYEIPWSLNAVVSTADTVLPMVRVTRYGPTCFILPRSTALTVSMISGSDVPPCCAHDARETVR